MKPKERYLNYALLSTANHCEPNQIPFKEDIPIDLSTKRSTPPSDHNHFGLFKAFDHPSFHSPPHGSDWTPAKYCFPNLLAKQYGYSPAIFPYLFINSSCLPSHELDRKGHEESLYEPYGLPYRLPQDGLLFPFKLDPYAHHPHPHHHHQQPHHQQQSQHLFHRHLVERLSDGDRAALSSESSSSSVPSSPYDHEYQHLQQVHEQQQNEAVRRTHRSSAVRLTQESTITPSLQGSQMFSSSSSSNSNINRGKLRKSSSQPNLSNLPSAGRSNRPSDGIRNLRRTKSEQNLHLIKSLSISPTKNCAPKKMFASNYYQNMKENFKECKENSNKDALNQSHNSGTPTRFYRNYRKEVIECWDNENKDTGRGTAENALDLRMTHNAPLHKLPNGLDKGSSSIKLNGHEKTATNYMTECNDAGKLELKHPVALPLDIYRQYYYYLIQEPSFASRAAVAAVAETYAKLMHSSAGEENGKASAVQHQHQHQHQHPQPQQTQLQQQQQTVFPQSSSAPVDKLDSGACTPYSESKRASPDFIVSGSRAELRSADTTNCGLPFDRKRISRPLTGKHVRHGTGASPSTLVSLRNMIQQRQKLKEIGKFDANGRFCKGKVNKRIKRK